jgi:hypothetical protein
MNPLPNLVACPYCYHKIDARRLSYQCNGRGSPGKSGCTPAPDPDREREVGNNEPGRTVFPPPPRRPFAPSHAECPKCGSRTGNRVCSCCHTPMSANFGAAASPLIAMVGATGTGKTVYLNVLAHELKNGIRRRFDADVRMPNARQTTVNLEQLYETSNMFAQTAQAASTGGRREPVVFEWRQQHSVAGIPRLRTTFLSFYDTAGEDLTRQDTAHELAYLGAADALVLLLDPFMIPQARNQISLPREAIRSQESTVDVVNRVTEALRIAHGVKSHKTIKIPVAIAFAKIDAFFDVLGPDHPLTQRPAAGAPPVYDETDGQRIHEYVRALLDDWKADDIDAHLRFNYSKFRYFAVSSLGAQPDYRQQSVDARGLHPFRVDEPLLWLLSLLGVIPSRESR